MKYPLAVAILVICFMSSVSAAQLPITHKGRPIGNVEAPKIQHDIDNQKLSISLTVNFSDFTKNLDQILASKGNFGSFHTRIYWNGNTSVRNTGKSLGLSSRLRYEKWWSKKVLGKRIKGRIFRDTKTVYWRLFINPASKDKIKIDARVENIRNFPNDLERFLTKRIPQEITVPIPVRCGNCDCSRITDSRKLELKSVNFSEADGTISLRVGLSIMTNVNGKLTDC